MTTMELEARKAKLVRDILTQVDDETLLENLIRYFNKAMSTTTEKYPLAMTTEEMKQSAIASAADMTNYSHQEVMKEMNDMMQEWK